MIDKTNPKMEFEIELNSPSYYCRQTSSKVNRLAFTGHQSKKVVLSEIVFRE